MDDEIEMLRSELDALKKELNDKQIFLRWAEEALEEMAHRMDRYGPSSRPTGRLIIDMYRTFRHYWVCKRAYLNAATYEV